MDGIEALCHRLIECAYWPGDFKIVDNACRKLREQREEIVRLKDVEARLRRQMSDILWEKDQSSDHRTGM